MPYVNIQVTREGVSADEKAQLIQGVTELLQRVLHKNPNTTFVVIEEVAMENWGVGGLPVAQWRAQQAQEHEA